MEIQQLKKDVKEILEPLDGKCGLALEWENREIFIQPHEQCPAASLIKIPILLEAFRQAEKNHIDLGKKVNISEEERVGGAGVLHQLSSELNPTLRDLLALMIIVSDNTATNRVIEELGIDSVNRLCAQLGLNQTTLQRKLFDFEAAERGCENYTSAHDMLDCLREIATGKQMGFSQQSRNEMIQMLGGQQFSNKIPAGIIQYDERDPFIAHKTGEVNGVEHDVGIIRYRGKEILLAVVMYDLTNNADGREAISEIGKSVIRAMGK